MKDLDLSCIENEADEAMSDENGDEQSLDLLLDYELELADYRRELREFQIVENQ